MSRVCGNDNTERRVYRRFSPTSAREPSIRFSAIEVADAEPEELTHEPVNWFKEIAYTLFCAAVVALAVSFFIFEVHP